MLTKRGFLIGGCAMAAQATLPASAQTPVIETMPADAFGCGVTTKKLETLEGGGWLRSVGETLDNRITTYDRSGDDLFDRMLARALVMMTEAFTVFPAFRYYDDADGKNAMATHHCLSAYDGKRCDGTVVFGARLAMELRPLPAGDAAILAICAHEFGHILAFKRDLRWELVNAGLKVRPNFELHADFMAGFFLRRYVRDFPTLDVRGVARAWLRMGSSDFTDPFWHGTNEMRRESIEAGYYLPDRAPRLSIMAAHNAGVRFLAERRWG